MEKQRPKLWTHQQKALKLAVNSTNYALFMEMGTGKTATMGHLIETLWAREGRPLTTLILCPLVVIPNWKKEILLHTGIPANKIRLLQGSQVKRVKQLTFEYGIIYITNYEAMLMKELFAGFLQIRPEILICDESQKLKTHNAKRTKQVQTLADITPHRYLLSGSPVLNSPMDLFSQYRIMDGGESFGNNFYAFRARYFYDAHSGMPSNVHFPNWKVRPDSIAKMNKIVNDTSFRVTKDECLDLPPLIKKTRHCPMTKEQATAYHQMEKDFITYIEGDAVVAQLALTKALRLMQIVSGFYKTAEGVEKSFRGCQRTAALKDLLEELTPKHKVIVWSCFKYNYKQIAKVCEGLNIKYVEAHGETTTKNKQLAIDTFNTDTTTRVFIGNQGALGIGINLTQASYSVYYSRNFSLEHDIQSESRNHRGGSEIHKAIVRIDLMTPDTIDELVLKRLAAKLSMGDKLLQAIKESL